MKNGKWNLSIQSEEEGAPAPWAKITTGDGCFSGVDDSISLSLLWRRRFAAGDESMAKLSFWNWKNNQNKFDEWIHALTSH